MPETLAGAVVKGRVNMSGSPLSRPSSLVHMVASKVQDYLYFPVPTPLYIVLGTLAANMMHGVPVWVQLVGAPSSGRTVLLETLASIPRLHIVGAIKSPSALLSGVARKDMGKGATGGLLRQIGSRGVLVMKDFTSMLSMPREPLGEAIGALREIYDGRYSRPLGTEGGRVLEWIGKIGFIGACTPALDRHHSVTSELGERWIYYRYPETDGYGETITMLGNKDPDAMMQELRDLMLSFFNALELSWDGIERRDLTQQEMNRLYAIASLTVAMRSPVPRDVRTHEIVDIAHKEAPTRLSAALGQMYLGLECIGLGEGERWEIVCKIAWDSAPQIRSRVLQRLRLCPTSPGRIEGVTVREVRGLIKCSTRMTGLCIEDMQIHGLVERLDKERRRMVVEDTTQASVVRLSKWAKEQMDLGFGRVVEKKEE